MRINSWTAMLMDAAPIAAIFGQAIPPLTGVVVHEITLSRDGPRATLRFDLPDFPARPPAKWAAAGFNRVQIRLMAIGVQSLQISGWPANLEIDLHIERFGSLARLSSEAADLKIVIDAASLMVESVTAYRMDTPS